jgi:predicted RNase H-like HicB family nuclease
MRDNNFKVIATASQGWWSLEVPAVPGAISQARTHEESIFMARDAISLILDIPRETISVEIEYSGELAESRI